MTRRFWWGIVFVAFILVGCASSTANLQRETARYIGDIHPSQVTIMNVRRGATNVSWEAATPKGQYDCSADDMLRRTYCVKK